jgi:hypothetical protein
VDVWITYAFVWLIGAVAWAKATQANWRTSLLGSVLWGWIAWTALCTALISAGPGSLYAALSLVGCAGVAVLGARRPGAAAWQFVVVALLGVMLLPFAEAVLRDRPLQLSGVRWAFLITLLTLVVVNYLPTRLGFAAALVATASAMALYPVIAGNNELNQLARFVGLGCTGAAPVVGWMCLSAGRSRRSAADRVWLDFRDRFGAIWALRLQEQFNRSAANAGLSTTLTWRGLRGTDSPQVYELLCALMKRFGLPANQNPGPPGPPPPP